jgi:hypothetical protein
MLVRRIMLQDKSLAQCMEALRAHRVSRLQPTSTN